MSRTDRSSNHRWYVREGKQQRRAWLKRQRAKARRRIKRGEFPGAERDERKTQGWLTW